MGRRKTAGEEERHGDGVADEVPRVDQGRGDDEGHDAAGVHPTTHKADGGWAQRR